MMKKASLLVFLFLGSLLAAPVDAHVLSTDGSIGAVMHINPNDDPVAGQDATFFFEFKDKAQKFSPDTCACSMTLLQNATSVYSAPLVSSSASYVFPVAGVYTVQVSGQPRIQNAFQPFTLTYDIRVEPGTIEKATSPTPWLSEHVIHLILIGGAVLFMVFFILKERRGQKALVLLLVALLLQHEHALPGTPLPDHPCCVQPSFDTSLPTIVVQPVFLAIALADEKPTALPSAVPTLFYNKSPPRV